MRRYDRSGRRDSEDLEARLNALRHSGSKKHRRKRRGSIISAVVGVLLLGAVFAAIYLIYTTAIGGESAPQAPAEPAKVEVIQGDTLSSVADKLEGAGIIQSAFMFKLQARMEGYGTQIKPGEYTFRPGEDGDKILAKLAEGEPVPTVAVTIPEGLTLDETAAAVADGTGVPEAKFREAARATDYGYAFLKDPDIKSTEGYLFPKQYEFEEGVTAPQVVDRLLGQYLIETEGLDIAGAKQRLNLTEHQLVTVASLIEKESANPQERPVIASVIYNRIRQGMPLQIDATIQYALERPKENLSLEDLKVQSPYNTYENTGLPPGPICSPSRQSIEAAIDPAETTHLYYVLKADGEEHFFTDDYNEFLAEKARAGR